jgi:hypothetical protein
MRVDASPVVLAASVHITGPVFVEVDDVVYCEIREEDWQV